MDEVKKQQLKWLKDIYDKWTPPTPAFKADHKGVPEGMVPYVSCSDVHDFKYNIRIIPVDIFLSKDNYEILEKGEIIAHYESMEDLVEDGWMLD